MSLTPVEIQSVHRSVLHRVLPWLACLSLAWALAARSTGPSDAWHQTQPRTMSYTTDMLVTGGSHWVLPSDSQGIAATKPPLYNWLAAPCVWLLGYSSEIAHKFPSIFAMGASWLLLVLLGRRIDIQRDEMLGWMAGLILPANYTMFKLCFLARPDMLLTLWLLIAWVISTALLIEFRRIGSHRRHRLLPTLFWISIALAGLTKGPAAAIAICYAIVAARVIGGSFRSLLALRPAGAIIPLCLVGGWLALAYQIDPQHAFQQLWFNELYGRVTGMGPEGARGGPEAWLTGMPNHFAYYAVRFLPWSLCTLAAMYVLWRTRHNHQAAWVQASNTPSHAHEKLRDWMIAAVVFAWLVVVLFTLSAGKRADYIAAAFGPGSLLAACWLLRMSRAFAIRLSWAGPTAAVLTLIALTIENRMDAFAPVKDFGEVVNSFVAETNQAIANEPLPIFVVWADDAPVHALLGLPGNHVQYDALDAARARTRFWVIAGRKIREPHEFSMWLRERFAKAEIKTVVQSELLPKLDCWPEQLTLYLVDAQRKSRSKRAKASTAPAT